MTSTGREYVKNLGGVSDMPMTVVNRVKEGILEELEKSNGHIEECDNITLTMYFMSEYNAELWQVRRAFDELKEEGVITYTVEGDTEVSTCNHVIKAWLQSSEQASDYAKEHRKASNTTGIAKSVTSKRAKRQERLNKAYNYLRSLAVDGVVAGKATKLIAKEFSLTEQSARKYLLELEEMGVIKRPLSWFNNIVVIGLDAQDDKLAEGQTADNNNSSSELTVQELEAASSDVEPAPRENLTVTNESHLCAAANSVLQEKEAEIARLRAELAEMKAKLDQISGILV